MTPDSIHNSAMQKAIENRPDRVIRPVSLSGKKVLVADNNKTNLEILIHILTAEDMRVTGLSGGRDVLPALQAAHQSGDPFDFCILDIEREGLSGYEIAKQIRDPKAKLSRLPLLAFSSPAERRAKQYLKAGFDGFLPTPIRRGRLIEMMIRLLGEEKPKSEAVAEPIQRELVTQHSIREETKHAVWILLAEDNLLSQKLAVLMLKKAGYQVEVVGTGKEVFDKYTDYPDKFSLIFMDIRMPEMDGLEATRRIRTWEKQQGAQYPGKAQKIPIVALTANAMVGDRERCLDAGMDDYASKPIERDVVFAMLTKWVRNDD